MSTSSLPFAIQTFLDCSDMTNGLVSTSFLSPRAQNWGVINTYKTRDNNKRRSCLGFWDTLSLVSQRHSSISTLMVGKRNQSLSWHFVTSVIKIRWRAPRHPRTRSPTSALKLFVPNNYVQPDIWGHLAPHYHLNFQSSGAVWKSRWLSWASRL